MPRLMVLFSLLPSLIRKRSFVGGLVCVCVCVFSDAYEGSSPVRLALSSPAIKVAFCAEMLPSSVLPKSSLFIVGKTTSLPLTLCRFLQCETLPFFIFQSSY